MRAWATDNATINIVLYYLWYLTDNATINIVLYTNWANTLCSPTKKKYTNWAKHPKLNEIIELRAWNKQKALHMTYDI